MIQNIVKGLAIYESVWPNILVSFIALNQLAFRRIVTRRIALPANILFCHVAGRFDQLYMLKFSKELIEGIVVYVIECEIAT